MCAILGVFNLRADDDLSSLRCMAQERSKRQRHRGPDWGGTYVDPGAILVHERLAIIDPAGGHQPLMSADGAVALIANGEIYNYRTLRRELREPYDYFTESDCEVISALYRQDRAVSFLNRMNGIFAFALWDRTEDRALIARDPMGVCPLYWGKDDEGRLWVASEMKALVGVSEGIEQFPPGYYYDSRKGAVDKYYDRPWRHYSKTRGVSVSLPELRRAFEDAVVRQLMTDVPFGVLLSGGLDSSLVAACAVRCVKGGPSAGSGTKGSPVHSFAIGLADSPDLAAAEVAAAALGTTHHAFRYTVAEGIDALSDVIRHVETYDVTTIRSAIPTYLLARRIKALGIKMVLSGEGSDEVFGGYLYFHRAPSAREFHDETVRKLDKLYLYDCLRANKAMMAWGVEMRLPFLDLEFLEVAMKIDAKEKMVGESGIEKAVLRRAFEGCLPREILWRQKEQFSDGVGYAWIESIQMHAATSVTDRELAAARTTFPTNTPLTKEAYLYRRIFKEHFPQDVCADTVPWGKSIACSSPAAVAWDASFSAVADPSGRMIAGVHNVPTVFTPQS